MIHVACVYECLFLVCAAAVDACTNALHHVQALTGASTVRALTRQTRRRAPDRCAGLTQLTRRPRTNFTSDQLRRLHQCFVDCPYIDVHQRAGIAAALSLTETQVVETVTNKLYKVV